MEDLTKGRRVERHTAPHVLHKIKQNTLENVEIYSKSPEILSRRIKQLEDEWDIERYLQVNAASVAFIGLVLGVLVNQYWLILSGLVLAFLWLHAVQGWCPPLAIFRRMGKRTRSEIDEEKHALKVIRGDYKFFSDPKDAFLAAQKH